MTLSRCLVNFLAPLGILLLANCGPAPIDPTPPTPPTPPSKMTPPDKMTPPTPPTHGGPTDMGPSEGDMTPTPPPAVASCKGKPVIASCSERDGLQYSCSSVKGCTPTDETCDGVADSCSWLFSSFTCTSQQGCYWSSVGSGSCSGIARSCSSVSVSSCYQQSGCHWVQSVCNGVPMACDTFTDANDCYAQTGCSWM